MKKIILVMNPAKLDLLDELGFSHCGERHMDGGKVAYQYVLTDKLHRVLKDRRNFSKADYWEDSRLTF